MLLVRDVVQKISSLTLLLGKTIMAMKKALVVDDSAADSVRHYPCFQFQNHDRPPPLLPGRIRHIEVSPVLFVPPVC